MEIVQRSASGPGKRRKGEREGEGIERKLTKTQKNYRDVIFDVPYLEKVEGGGIFMRYFFFSF